MINADVTAENKPDCVKLRGKYQVPSNLQNPTPGTRINTHKDKGGIQILVVLLLKVPVVFFHFSLKLVVELHSGVNPRPSAAQHGL